MMAEQPKATGAEHGGKRPFDGVRKTPSNPTPTLAEAGIDKNLLLAAPFPSYRIPLSRAAGLDACG
jgi:hypothetical protein